MKTKSNPPTPRRAVTRYLNQRRKAPASVSALVAEFGNEAVTRAITKAKGSPLSVADILRNRSTAGAFALRR